MGNDIVAQTIKTRADIDKNSLKTYKKAISEGRRKKYAESLKLYEKVLKKHPEFIDAQLRRAGMLHNLKRYEESAVEFEKAIAMAPEYDPQMYFSLAIVNRDMKRFDLAAQNFQFFIDPYLGIPQSSSKQSLPSGQTLPWPASILACRLPPNPEIFD